MFGRPIPLTLTQKGLLLVIIPLVVELLVISTLAGLLLKAEERNRSYLRGRAISAQTTRVSELMHTAAMALTAYNNTGHNTFIDRYDRSVAQIPVEVTRLELELGPSYSRKSGFTEFKATVDSGIGILDQAKTSVDTGKSTPDSGLLEANTTYRHILNLTDKLKQQTDLLYMQAGATPEKAPPPQNAPIKGWLIGGIIVNVLLAVGLAFFFNKSIARRINHVRDNAVRYARGQTPRQLPSAHDELSDLDAEMGKMAEALLEASERERQVIENAAEVILTIADNGMVKLASQSAERLWHYKSEELLGGRLIELIDEGSRATIQSAFEQAKESSAPVTFEASVIDAAGGVIEMQWSTTWSSANKCMFCVAHDISERKKVEKLKQDLVQMVSHDLRSPLTSLSFFLNLIEMGIGETDAPTMQAKARNMRLEVLRLIDLINNLLDLEKLNAGKMELDKDIIDISIVAERAVNALLPLAEYRDVTIDRNVTAALVCADEDKLVQALINFLANAIKFSPKGSVIDFEATASDDSVRVSVRDRGPGIAKEDQARIFNQFEQLAMKGERKSVGSGLGLAITKQVMDMHGGEVGVESTPGAGSTFWLSLPRVSDPID